MFHRDRHFPAVFASRRDNVRPLCIAGATRSLEGTNRGMLKVRRPVCKLPGKLTERQGSLELGLCKTAGQQPTGRLPSISLPIGSSQRGVSA